MIMYQLGKTTENATLSNYVAIYSLRFGTKTSMRQPVAKVLGTLYRILASMAFHDLLLVIPPPPFIKVSRITIQDHAQNWEKTTLNGRAGREVSIISHRPVTSSDLKQERSCFRRSVLSFSLQLVVSLKQALHFGDIVKRHTRAPAKGDAWIQTRS